MALICDTGPLYAAMDRAEQDHARCAELINGVREQLVVPSPVLVELEWLTGARLGSHAFEVFLLQIERGRVRVEDLRRDDYSRIRELYTQYADLPLGFVDAAVLTILERFGETKLATLDHRHFRVVRPRHAAVLTLLPATN